MLLLRARHPPLPSLRLPLSRLASTSSRPPNPYSSTLLLPKTQFPLRADAAKREHLFRPRTTAALYRWQREHLDTGEGEEWIFHDGPPYANGRLHMGHALNKVLKDMINRYRVLSGQRVHYVPGWDTHGLPIEQKALAELRADHRALSPVAVREAAKRTALDAIEMQKDEFEALGLMADLRDERATYRTLDHEYEMRQLELFRSMVAKGLVHRAHRPVYWSPSSRTALAEAELEYADAHVSQSVYVRFPAVFEGEGVGLVCWTTTPWSLVGNMAISVNPDLEYSLVQREADGDALILASERVSALESLLGPLTVQRTFPGSALLSVRYTPPFHQYTLGAPAPSYPILSAQHVTSTSGTGLVHTAPAHGNEDYLAYRSYLSSLPASSSPPTTTTSSAIGEDLLSPVDVDGRFASEAVRKICGRTDGTRLDGLECLGEGAREVVRLLREREAQERGRKWVLAEERVEHRYPYDWRTKKPVLIRATSQWFANVDELKQTAIDALEGVQFIPPLGQNRLSSFVSSRSEWCISRQRAWGVPIPILFHTPSSTPVLDPSVLAHTLSVLNAHGTSAWFALPASTFLPPALAKRADEYEKGTDTMDVWFDSGTSWTGLPGAREGRKADVYLEGSDQHRGWFQSSLLTSVAQRGDAPYRRCITHGMVVDERGMKMSKSLGNGISPMDIIKGGKDPQKLPPYGADVLRYWAASVEYARDVPIGPTVIAHASEALRKIRNSARFILGNVRAAGLDALVQREDMEVIEKWVMHELAVLEERCREGYEAFAFNRVTQALNNFSTTTLSLYFESTKDALYNDSAVSLHRRSIVTVLQHVLRIYLSVIAPIAPHLAEEIAHFRDTDAPAKRVEDVGKQSVFEEGWQRVDPQWRDEAVAQEMELLLDVRNQLTTLLEEARTAKKLKTSLEAEVDIVLSDKVAPSHRALLEKHAHVLPKLLVVSDASLSSTPPSPAWSFSAPAPALPGVTLVIRPSTRHKCPRCWAFTRAETEGMCGRCADVLQGRSG